VGELEEARTEEMTDAFRNVTRYNPKVLAVRGFSGDISMGKDPGQGSPFFVKL
jgi:hypothetical protein